ncbi:MAG: dual specificity protein phosphatase family protein, partial [bacterium]
WVFSLSLYYIYIYNTWTTPKSSCSGPRHSDNAYKFMLGAITSGGKVFVHCSAGVSRSASLVIYFMMRKHKVRV